MPVFEYDPPERFVAGTVGQPGQRSFYLQARGAGRTTTVALEKQQVAVLAERVEELLDEVVRRTGGEAPVPAVTPNDLVDNEPLDMPVNEEFRVGSMSLSWDGDRQCVVIECHEVREDDLPVEELEAEAESDDPAAPTMLRVVVNGATARSFASRATALVSAGRPPCPFCGNPIDADGHICPRANGYRR